MSGVGIRRCCCVTEYNVEKYDDTGTGSAPASLWTYQAGTSGTSPLGIRTDSSGNAYILYYNSGYYVDKVNTSGVFQSTFSVAAIGTGQPGIYDVDDSGNVYTLVSDSGIKVKKYNSSGTLQWTSAALTSPGVASYALAVDRSGTAGVAAFTKDTASGSSKNDMHSINTSGTVNWSQDSWPSGFGSSFAYAQIGHMNSSGDVFYHSSSGGTGVPGIGLWDSTPTEQWSHPSKWAGSLSAVTAMLHPVPQDSSGNYGTTTSTTLRRVDSSGAEVDSFTDSDLNFQGVALCFNSDDDYVYSYSDLSPADWHIKKSTTTGTEVWNIDDGWKHIWVGPSDQMWATGEQK